MPPFCNRNVIIENGSASIQGYTLSIPNVILVRELLPHGANGVVFEAKDNILNRKVAVKVWIPRESDHRSRSQQALAEIRKVAQLDHNKIVRIYSAGKLQNDWIYSIMEFIDGQTLRDSLSSGHFDQFPADRIHIWNNIYEAIVYAHSQGVYHGDLHDRNVIMVNNAANKYVLKVIDFGTSMFAGNVQDSRLRESKLLVKLSQIIMSECKPGLFNIIDSDISILKPELTLSVLSAWENVIAHWGFRTRHAIPYLAFSICNAPVISFTKILAMLTEKGYSDKEQESFLAYCTHHAEVNTKIYLQHQKHPIETPLIMDRKYSELKLKRLWPALRSCFIENGPFD